MSPAVTMAGAITALVAEKRAVGYKYDAEERVLARFAAFCASRFPELEAPDQASAEAWIAAARQRGVKPATLHGLAAPVRELARWLGRRGVPAYILPGGALPRPARYVPHIYTDQELAALFAQTDRCHYDSQVPFRHLVMPVLFRTIYACGLRASEARLLRFADVDLETGVLTIRNGKGGKDRQVPVSAPLAAAVTGFLNWLEAERHNSISTRNQRLAGLSSFFRWLQSQDPARMAGCQDILAVPAKKKSRPGVNHLTAGQARRLLAAPDRSTRRGRRDATLLATLYDSAARVSELADLTVGDIRVQPPPLAVLTGKGRKIRHVPLGGNTTALLSAYLAEHGLDQPGRAGHPLFANQHGTRLSRGGIAWIIRKYQAQAGDPALTEADLSPHVLRHSRAMHLYEAGVPLPYIRDLLGHVELATTDIYARASTEAKRKALEAACTNVVVTDDLPEWNQDAGLLSWLTSL